MPDNPQLLNKGNILHEDNIRYFICKGRTEQGAAVRKTFAGAGRSVIRLIVRIIRLGG